MPSALPAYGNELILMLKGSALASGNELILMLKGSALASTITLLDLTGVARTLIARTYLAVELFAVAGLIYLILTLLIVRGVHLLERRWTVPDQPLETVPATRHGDLLS